MIRQAYCRDGNRLLCVFLSACVAVACLGMTTIPAATASSIYFNFENTDDNDNPTAHDPTFSSEGLTISFQTATPDIAQWANDDRSRPHSGTGSMRLSDTGFTLYQSIEAEMVFSQPIGSFSLYVENINFNIRYVPDFVIAALDENGQVLDTVSIEPESDQTTSVWSEVTFAGLGQIHRLKLTGMSNHVYWDDLTVTVVPEPATIGLLLAGGVAYLVGRSTRQIRPLD